MQEKYNIIHVCEFLGMQSLRISLILVLEGFVFHYICRPAKCLTFCGTVPHSDNKKVLKSGMSLILSFCLLCFAMHAILVSLIPKLDVPHSGIQRLAGLYLGKIPFWDSYYIF